MKRVLTPGERARLAADYSLKEAAKKVRRNQHTKLSSVMRQIRNAELHGGASDFLCEQLGTLYNCNPDLFFFPPSYWREWELLKGRDCVTGRPFKAEQSAQAETKPAVSHCEAAASHAEQSATAARGADAVSTHKASHRAARRPRKLPNPNKLLIFEKV
jgi:hypothetical protein